MSSAVPYRVGCYLARPHGLSGLRALLDCPRYQVAVVMTHRRKAKFEDRSRSQRPDYAEYQALTQAHGVPLWAVDSKKARDGLPARLSPLNLDLLASISWRMLINPPELAVPRLGGVNLHRGKLPDYPGGLPLQQALEHGDTDVVISAHVLAEEIDAGPILATASHPVGARPAESLEDQVERLKGEITPLFGPLLIRALDAQVAAAEEG